MLGFNVCGRKDYVFDDFALSLNLSISFKTFLTFCNLPAFVLENCFILIAMYSGRK